MQLWSKNYYIQNVQNRRAHVSQGLISHGRVFMFLRAFAQSSDFLFFIFWGVRVQVFLNWLHAGPVGVGLHHFFRAETLRFLALRKMSRILDPIV